MPNHPPQARLRRFSNASGVVLEEDATRAPAPPHHIEDCAPITKGEADGLLSVVDILHSWAEGISDANEYEVLNGPSPAFVTSCIA